MCDLNYAQLVLMREGGGAEWEQGDNRVIRLTAPPGWVPPTPATTTSTSKKRAARKAVGGSKRLEKSSPDTSPGSSTQAQSTNEPNVMREGQYTLLCHYGMPLNYQAVYQTLLPGAEVAFCLVCV